VKIYWRYEDEKKRLKPFKTGSVPYSITPQRDWKFDVQRSSVKIQWQAQMRLPPLASPKRLTYCWCFAIFPF
jgi:hypothetical protein